ncbi:hypothetical protein C9926_00585 [Sulfurovum lithotrophicum]|nr:hypothetical protein C9926_00585 [Sulfurovum lithotrophicum]
MKEVLLIGIFLGFLKGCGTNSLTDSVNTNTNTTSESPSSGTTTGTTPVTTDIDINRGATLYTTCAGCHGANAEKNALGKSAVIGGQNVLITIAELEDYRAGTLNQYGMGELMKGQVVSFSDQDIKDVSKYVESLSGF